MKKLQKLISLIACIGLVLPNSAKNLESKSDNLSSLPIVLLDPGHGGEKDPGACRFLGVEYCEKNITRLIAKEVKEKLESQKIAQVKSTRPLDQDITTNLSIDKRWYVCQSLKPHLALSIHIDDYESEIRKVKGFTSITNTYYILNTYDPSIHLVGEYITETAKQRENKTQPLIDFNKDFATNVVKSIVAFTGFPNQGVVDESETRVGQVGFARCPHIPSILIEAGTIYDLNTPQDETLTKLKITKIAEGIADAIKKTLLSPQVLWNQLPFNGFGKQQQSLAARVYRPNNTTVIKGVNFYAKYNDKWVTLCSLVNTAINSVYECKWAPPEDLVDNQTITFSFHVIDENNKSIANPDGEVERVFNPRFVPTSVTPVPQKGVVTTKLLGQGLDQCDFFSPSQLETIANDGKFKALGVYIGGEDHACRGNDYDAKISSNIPTAKNLGFKFMPIWVGPQSPCHNTMKSDVIPSDINKAYTQDVTKIRPAIKLGEERIPDNINEAYNRGVTEATQAIQSAIKFGLAQADGSNSIIYYDLEPYMWSRSEADSSCNRAVKSFINGWTKTIHDKNSKSGVYTNGYSAWSFKDLANKPDGIWVFQHFSNVYLPDSELDVWDINGLDNHVTEQWGNHERIQQYSVSGDIKIYEYGVEVDRNFIDGWVVDANGSGGGSNPTSTQVQLRLPWNNNETATYNQGPHGHNGTRNEVLNALDIGMWEGQPVVAAHSGIARIMGESCMKVDYNNGEWSTHYFHLSAITVADGTTVSSGQVIGNAGKKYGGSCGGYAEGSHLHFALFKDNNPYPLDGLKIGGWLIKNGRWFESWEADMEGYFDATMTHENPSASVTAPARGANPSIMNYGESSGLPGVSIPTPQPPSLVANVNLIANGSMDSATNWTFWNLGGIERQFKDGVLLMKRTTGSTQGSVYQDIRSLPANAPVDIFVKLGNSSNVVKTPNIALHKAGAWDNAISCTFSLPPNSPLRIYRIRGRLPAEAWTSPRFEVAPTPADSLPDVLMDDVYVTYRPDMSVPNTECIELDKPIAGEIIMDNRSAQLSNATHFMSVSGGFEYPCVYADNAIWTKNATSATEDFVTYRPNMTYAGVYEVLVRFPDVPNGMSDTNKARYVIRHNDGETIVTVPQNNNYCNWVSLGKYHFANGSNGYVRLEDQTGESYQSRSLIADVIKFVPALQYDVNTPFDNVSTNSRLPMRGWAINRNCVDGSGVNAIDVYEGAAGQPQAKMLLSMTTTNKTYGLSRIDVKNALEGNARYQASGWEESVDIRAWTPGAHKLYIYIRNACDNTWSSPIIRTVNIVPPNYSIDSPTPNATVTDSLSVYGWAFDQTCNFGTGIDKIDVYRGGMVNQPGSEFVGTATYGITRTDVVSVFNTLPNAIRFRNSGWSLNTSTNRWNVGMHTLYIYFHSACQNKDDFAAPITRTIVVAPKDVIPPTGSITFPATAIITRSNIITATATAADNNGGSGVKLLRFYRDTASTSTLVCEVFAAPYQCALNFTNLPDGNYAVHIDIQDNAGNWAFALGGQKSIVIDRKPIDSTPPTGTLTSPVHLSISNSPVFSITATASDNVGGSGVAWVKFFAYYDGTWKEIGTVTTVPYGLNWTLPAGVKDQDVSFTMHVQDKAGNLVQNPGGTRIVKLDRAMPTSAVNALAAVQNSTTFSVTWAGSDVGSGIKCYDVQYSLNVQTAWTAWLTCTTATSANFTATNGTIVYFRSSAKDAAGNVEAYPAAYDAMTTLPVAAKPDLRPFASTGYTDSVVASSAPSTTVANKMVVGKPAYIDWCFINDSTQAITTSFVADLFVDNVRQGRAIIASMGAKAAMCVKDTKITISSVGNHTIKMVLDSESKIAEASESNNTWEKAIYWYPTALATTRADTSEVSVSDAQILDTPTLLDMLVAESVIVGENDDEMSRMTPIMHEKITVEQVNFDEPPTLPSNE